MNQQQLEDLTKQLQTKKDQLESELSSFTTKDPNVKGDWDTKFPRTPEGNLEEAADDVEEYSTRLHIEFTLETQLKDIEKALENIEKGTYGICEKCEKPISPMRLGASPEARFCTNCN